MFIVLKVPSTRAGEGGRSGPVIGLGGLESTVANGSREVCWELPRKIFPCSFLLVRIAMLEDVWCHSSHLGTMKGKPREWKIR